MVPPGSRQALSNLPDNTVGAFAESDPVRLPDLVTVFARRAERLAALAPGHELEGFLRLIAALVSAQHEAAMLTTFNEVDMSAVMDLRKKYQDDFVKKNGVKLGFMSFFTKAVVHALREVPAVNARIDGDTIVQNHYYDVSMAVSTDKGLMVPVIRNCDSLGMADIEKAIGEAAKKARDGKITLADLEGGAAVGLDQGIDLKAHDLMEAHEVAITDCLFATATHQRTPRA